MKKIFFSILTLFLFLFTSHQVVSADQAIDASIRSDGQDTLTVKVENHQDQALNQVNYQLDLPKGYELVDDLPTLQELGSQQSHEFDVKVKKTAESLPNTGEKWVKWTVIGLALLALLLVAYYYVKTRKVLFLLFLAAGILGLGGLVKAAPIYQELAVGQRVTLFGVELPVTLHIYYDEEGEVVTPAKKESGSEDMAKETESSATSSQAEEPTATLPTMETPVAPTPSVPSQPSVDTPVVPTPDVPSQPSVETPVTPAPEVSSQPSVETPVSPMPSVPSQPSVDTPVVPTPDVPSQPSVDTPVVPTPDVPSQPSVDTPVVPVPEVPSQPSVDTPVVPVPEVPSQPSVDTPVVPEPTVPSQPSVDTPVVPTPEVPSQPSVDTPVAPEPTVPSKPSEDVPVKPTPSTPENPSEDIAIPGETEQTPPEEVLISGYAYSGTTNKALEETNITISAPSVETRTVETEVDGYFYTHLLKGITYTLNAKDFKVSLTANGNNDFQVDNILGRFSAGKQTKTESGEVVLQPSVVQFDTVVDYVVSEKDHHVTLPEERKLNPGDIIVLPSSGTYPTGFAYKVVSSTVVNGKTEIVVADAKLEEVAKDIKYHETFGVDQAKFVPAEGVTVTEEEEQPDNLGNRAVAASATKKFSTKVAGVDIDLVIKGSVEADADVFKGKMYVKPALDIELSSKYKAEAKIHQEVKLGEFVFVSQIGATIKTELYIFVDAKGSLEIKTKSNFGVSAELGIKDWNPYFTQKVGLSNRIDVDMKALLKIGPKVIFRPGFVNIDAVAFDAAVGLGLDGQFNATITQKNSEKPVLESASGKVLLFGDFTLGYDVNFLFYKKSGKFIENKRFFEFPLSQGKYTSKKEQASHSNIANGAMGGVNNPIISNGSNVGEFRLNDYPVYKRYLETYANLDGRGASFMKNTGRPVTYALYDVNHDGLPELIFLADNHPIGISTMGTTDWGNPEYGKDEVYGIASADYLPNSTQSPGLVIYQDGTIKKYIEFNNSYHPEKIDKKFYQISKMEDDRARSTEIANYESNWAIDFAYFYNVKNESDHASIAELDSKYIKSPVVDFSKVPQAILMDYYGNQKFTAYTEKTVDLNKWLGYKYRLEDDAKSERESIGLAYSLRPLIDKPVEYTFYDIDGNGTPELIYRSSDVILSIITSTKEYSFNDPRHYGKGSSAYLVGNSANIVYSRIHYTEEDGRIKEEVTYHRTDGGLKIYKDGTIRLYSPDPDISGVNTRASSRSVQYYKIYKNIPKVYELGNFRSNREDGLENYYNSSNTEHRTLEELDRYYIHSEEIDQSSLVWKKLVDFDNATVA